MGVSSQEYSKSKSTSHHSVQDSSKGAASLTVRGADLRTSIRPTVAKVNLGALVYNVGRIRAEVGPAVHIFGVIKADAYGHGAVPVAQALQNHVEAFAVSLVEEGLELRAAGIEKKIIVLGAHYGGFESEVLEHDLTPVIYDLEQLERFGKAPQRRAQSDKKLSAPSSDSRSPVHVKIETGMNRLGVTPANLPRFLQGISRFPHLVLEGACTHFASADLEAEAPTLAQLETFNRCLEIFQTAGIHLQVVHAANSAASFRFPKARFGAVRPGLAMYGAMPSLVVPCPDLKPVLSLRSRIMALNTVSPGQGVSYGGRWIASRPSSIATIPIGYADGYPRHVKAAAVLIRGQQAPVVGSVCMDMMMVDVTAIPDAAIGDEVTLVGKDGNQSITVDDVARWAGTISYEILCGISKRVPRIYSGSEAQAE